MDTVAAKPSAAACSRSPGDTEGPSATSHEDGLGSYGKRLIQGGPRFRWRTQLWNHVAGLHERTEPLGPQGASSRPDLVYRITGSTESRKLSLGQVPALPSAEGVVLGGCKCHLKLAGQLLPDRRASLWEVPGSFPVLGLADGLWARLFGKESSRAETAT